MSLPNDIIGLHDGRTMLVHPPTACEGRACCIHNPSAHVLDTAPLSWRADTRAMERVCKHSISHPDPDDLAWKEVVHGAGAAWVHGIHSCDGCCRGVTP